MDIKVHTKPPSATLVHVQCFQATQIRNISLNFIHLYELTGYGNLKK